MDHQMCYKRPSGTPGPAPPATSRRLPSSGTSTEKSIREFGDRLQDDNTVGLFYYAGQGAQADGRNFLIPVDADVKATDELSYTAVDMESVLVKMRSAGNKLNIAVIDASHENPCPGSRKSAAKGLAEPRMRVPRIALEFE